MLLCLNRCFRQLEVRLRCRSDHDKMDVGILHQLLGGVVHSGIGMGFGCSVVCCRPPLDDGCQAEFRTGGDEGNVEYLCTEAVSDHADVDG